MEEKSFSISENVEFVVSMIAPRAKERGQLITLEMEIENDVILGDSLRLNQVLLNLLSNAVKFSHTGGRIECTVEELPPREDKSVYRFSVKDYGIGIEKEKIERLFRPFEQADTQISRTYGGTGLGLTISKKMVDMMGGEFAVKSEKGKGSIFSFTIQVPLRVNAVSREEVGAQPELLKHDLSKLTTQIGRASCRERV